MTEAEWLVCADPWAMQKFLKGKASDRKLRLFAAASFRRLSALLPDPRQQRGLEVLEHLAEGTVSRAACRRATAEVRHAIPWNDGAASMPLADDPYYVALMFYREFCSSSIAVHALQATAGLADGVGEQHEQVRLMRCIFGNPFRPASYDPAWRTRSVVSLAEAAYQERTQPLGELNPVRLAVLADALEDVGCTNADLLAHLRSPRPHVRGCFALDLILDRK